jgi:class 3 adenylate cyclase
MAVLREYHGSLAGLIHSFEGTLERFAGDGLMVLFNDPMPCPDPCERAVKMAVQMRDRVIDLAAKWKKLGHDLGFGVGIAHGYATLGRISSEGRFDYTAIGRVVNLAARLCGEAKSGQILIDGKVHTAVEALAETAEIGELELKGFHRPVSAFDVLGIRG